MDKDQVREFARLIGTKVESVSSQGWAQVKCPLARWTHDSGKDSNPSAAISVVPNGYSRFTCFTCETHDLLGLAMRLRELGAKAPKVDIKGAVALASSEDDADVHLAIKDYDAPVYSAEEDDGNNDAVFDEDWLATFKRALHVPMAREYLRKVRAMDDHTMEELDVRWDASRRTVCFPIRDVYGVLSGLRGRRIAPTGDQPSYHMYKNGKGKDGGHYNRQVWIGENHLDFDKPLLLVESVFDYAACYPFYPNVAGPLTVGFGPRKAKRLALASDIVTLFDTGAGGDKARSRIDKYLPGASITHLHPTGPHRTKDGPAKDPDEMRRPVLLDLLSEHLPL